MSDMLGDKAEDMAAKSHSNKSKHKINDNHPAKEKLRDYLASPGLPTISPASSMHMGLAFGVCENGRIPGLSNHWRIPKESIVHQEA